MRITPDGDSVAISGQSGDSRELVNIATHLMPEWLRLFAAKNADYGDGAKVLGVRGQYADINRKMLKLKRSLWDGDQLQFEDSDEVIMDLIGHLFLTLDMIRFKEQTDRSHAFSDLSTSEFVERFISELGGPEQALRVSATLSEALSSRVTNRCREMLGDNIVHSAWMPDKRVSVAERMAGEEFAQADFEQSDHAAAIASEVRGDRPFRLGGITSITFSEVGEDVQQALMAERLKRGTDEALYGERDGAAEGSPAEDAASAYADDEGFPTPTLLDLIDQSNKLADEQRRIATQMYKMTRGL